MNPLWQGSAGQYLDMPEEQRRMLAQAQPTYGGGQQQMPQPGQPPPAPGGPPTLQPQQPPPDQGVPVGGQPTLGQVAPAAGRAPTPDQGGGFSDYLSHYQQALQTARSIIQPAKREYVRREDNPVPLWQGIMTMGGAVHAHDQAVMRQNEQAYNYNKALELTASDLAMDMTKSYADAQARAGHTELEQFGMAMRVKEFELNAKKAEWQRLHQEHQDLTRPERTPTEQEIRVRDAMGDEPGAHGGWVKKGTRLQQQPGGGYLPPAKGSAADRELGLGDNDAGTEGGTAGSVAENLERDRQARKASDTANAATAKAKGPQVEEVSSNIEQVRSFLDDPEFDKSISLLPSAGGSGAAGYVKKRVLGPMSMAIRGSAGDARAAFLQSAKRTIIPMVRVDALGTKGMRINLAEISMLGDQLNALAEGKMTREEALAFRQRARNWLKNIETRVHGQEPGLGAQTRTTTPTTTTTTTTEPEAGGQGAGGHGTMGVTPGGTKYRVVE